jgi:DUF4097 and DUF4098 domain-containing protein YvlB
MDWIAEGIEISAVSSNVTVELPEVQETKIETVSGNIDIRCERSKEISFSTVSGHAGFTGNCEELDCESVSGNCKVALWGNAKEIQMESISGDLEITLDDQFGFTAQLDSVSGRISSDFSANVSDQTHTYGDGSIRIEAETVSGGIRIRKE